MAETPEAPAPQQPRGSGKTFSTLLLVVGTAAISIAVAYGLMRSTNQETRAEIAKVQTQVSTDSSRLSNQLVESDRTQEALKQQIAVLETRAKKLEDEKKQLADKLSAVSTGFEQVAADFGKFAKGQEVLDKTQTSDIIATNTNVKKLEDRVHYIDDKLKRIDDLERDVLGLKGDSGLLKDEFKGLRADMHSVRSKTEITEKDIADLTDRTRMFQLRVLAARAREAADAARKVDLETLLTRLDEVDEK